MAADLRQLASLAAASDPFALLDLPHQYDLDLSALQERYLRLSRQVHPDFFAADPDRLPLAEAVSAALNLALATLQDPVRRAEYLLVNHGGSPKTQDKRVPPEALAEALSFQEQLHAAQDARDAAALSDLRRQLLTRNESLLDQIAALARQLPNIPAAPAPPDTLAALRLALNSMSFLQNLLARL